MWRALAAAAFLVCASFALADGVSVPLAFPTDPGADGAASYPAVTSSAMTAQVISQDGATNRNSGTASGATTVDSPAGNLIVCAVSGVGSTIASMTDSASNTYVKAVSSNTNFDIEIWYKSSAAHLPVGGTMTPVVTNNADQYSLNVCATYHTTNGTVDKTATAHSTGAVTTLSVGPTGTTSNANEMAFAAMNGVASGSWTEASGWTELATNPTSTNPLAYQFKASTGTLTWAPTFPSSTVDGVIAVFGPP